VRQPTNQPLGFTLIELMIVIAIIGILSSVVLASLNGARESSRNARRQSDLGQLQTAMELYANDNGDYNVSGKAALSPDYIQTVPSDPSDSATDYQLDSSASGYCISAPGYEATSSAGYPDNDTSCSSDYSVGPGT